MTPAEKSRKSKKAQFNDFLIGAPRVLEGLLNHNPSAARPSRVPSILLHPMLDPESKSLYRFKDQPNKSNLGFITMG
jgi:hypothetical protein